MDSGNNTVKLEEICAQITDGKHGDCQDQAESGFYFLSCKDVSDGKLNYEGARQITEADFRETHRRTRLEPSDILVTNSGTIGRMAVAPDNDLTRRTTFQKSVAILKPIPSRVEPRFLYYALCSDLRRLIEFAGGTAQKNLLLRDLRAFSIELPSLPVQRCLAAILSAYDDLIENNTRRIQILERMAHAIYREWFVHFRFPGHAKVKMVASPLGEVPQRWSVRRLDEIAVVNGSSIRRGQEPEDILYVDISSVATGHIEKIEPVAFIDAPGRARRIVQHGDTIWSCVRPNRKSFSLITEPAPNLIVSTGFAVLTPTAVPFSFLHQAVTTDDFVGYLTNHATGAAYPAVTAKDFEAARILVPDEPLLRCFHEHCEPTLLLKENLLRKNANFRRTRDLLLPRLLSGQIELRPD